jgi:hypothetical protein
MAEIRDSEDSFFEHYEKYIVARQRKETLLIWLHTVYCRRKLQELGSTSFPKSEEEIMENLFVAFVPKQDVSSMHKGLVEDSTAKTAIGNIH